MRHDTRATYFKAHLYSLDCCKYTNYHCCPVKVGKSFFETVET